ncbi:MAG: hypothetical protein U5N86_04940 [Planctomycetota bacterium]|nr:hypothetical protein [Planctomycetota bacterium]
MKLMYMIVFLGLCLLLQACSPSYDASYAFVVHKHNSTVFVYSESHDSVSIDIWRLSSTEASHKKLHTVVITNETSSIPCAGYKDSIYLSHSGRTMSVNAEGEISIVSEGSYDSLWPSDSEGICVAVYDDTACLLSLKNGQEIASLGEWKWSGAYLHKDLLLLWEGSNLEIWNRRTGSVEQVVLESKIYAVDIQSEMLAVLCSFHLYTYHLDRTNSLQETRRLELYPSFIGHCLHIVNANTLVGGYGLFSNPVVFDLSDANDGFLELDFRESPPYGTLLIPFDDCFIGAVNPSQSSEYELIRIPYKELLKQ